MNFIKRKDNMKLVVGLGNPGKEYENTRHNIGFMMIDEIVKTYNLTGKEKMNGLYYELNVKGEKVYLLKPLSYMNLSGEVVRKYIDYFKINIEDILIINDDLDLPIGTHKLREKGSSGGHNGLKNIEQHLNTNNYKRLKIGISNNKNIDTKDYVLGRFSKEDMNELNNFIKLAPDVLEDFITLSFTNLMNKYNN